jgi:predicted exporter
MGLVTERRPRIALKKRAMHWRPHPTVRQLLSVALVGLAAACTHVQPYERAQLAHPTMSTSDLARPAEGHVRAVQEGALGGDFSAGGGCGCN